MFAALDTAALPRACDGRTAKGERKLESFLHVHGEASSTAYEWFLFAHILGAFVLLAATGLTTGAAIAARRARHAPTLVTLLDLQHWSESAVTSVGAVLVFLFGTLLVNEAGHEFSEAWISAAYALLIGALALDHGVYLRHVRRVRRAAAELGEGSVTEAVRQQVAAPLPTAVGVLLTLAWLVALWLMVVKPGA